MFCNRSLMSESHDPGQGCTHILYPAQQATKKRTLYAAYSRILCRSDSCVSTDNYAGDFDLDDDVR